MFKPYFPYILPYDKYYYELRMNGKSDKKPKEKLLSLILISNEYYIKSIIKLCDHIRSQQIFCLNTILLSDIHFFYFPYIYAKPYFIPISCGFLIHLLVMLTIQIKPISYIWIWTIHKRFNLFNYCRYVSDLVEHTYIHICI